MPFTALRATDMNPWYSSSIKPQLAVALDLSSKMEYEEICLIGPDIPSPTVSILLWALYSLFALHRCRPTTLPVAVIPHPPSSPLP
jgi:hypothetical protein